MPQNGVRPKGDPMDVQQTTKQMIDLQKMAFDSWYNAAAILQTQTASVIDMMLGPATGVPEDGRQAMRRWIQVCGQERDRFKAYVDDSFAGMAELLCESGKTGTKTSKKTAKEGN